MPSFNNVTLVGNLTKDPELRYIPSGTAVCEFTVAVNKRYKDKQGNMKDEVSFIDCVTWAKGAENFAKYMAKGLPVLVNGSLKQERWESPDGQKRSKIRVSVSDFQFLGKKKDGEGAGPADDAPPVNEDIPF